MFNRQSYPSSVSHGTVEDVLNTVPKWVNLTSKELSKTRNDFTAVHSAYPDVAKSWVKQALKLYNIALIVSQTDEVRNLKPILKQVGSGFKELSERRAYLIEANKLILRAEMNASYYKDQIGVLKLERQINKLVLFLEQPYVPLGGHLFLSLALDEQRTKIKDMRIKIEKLNANFDILKSKHRDTETDKVDSMFQWVPIRPQKATMTQLDELPVN